MELTNEIEINALLSELAYLELENYDQYKDKKYPNIYDVLLAGDKKEIVDFITFSSFPTSTLGMHIKTK